MKASENYIFYIRLSPRLPKSFYKLAREFSKEGIHLIPVEIETLSELMDSRKRAHILCHVADANEREFYFKKVHKLLCYLVRSQRSYYYLLSGYKKLMNREAFHSGAKNYSFLELPATCREICDRIILSFYQRKKAELKWPGGRPHLLPLVREL